MDLGWDLPVGSGGGGVHPLDGLGVGPPCGEWGGGVHPLDGLGVGPPCGEWVTHLMDLGWDLAVGSGGGGVHPLDGLGVGPPFGASILLLLFDLGFGATQEVGVDDCLQRLRHLHSQPLLSSCGVPLPRLHTAR